ncbi:pulmonary surfactant-associated protein C [Platysternon megacephalum]|uniref:Pulmonary surfactant-associated protein C n=1 Tax=Platysternon megacephalum TaxID=55544 RepID=A0A4D9EP70_9SAUR|nr:pulmonary surfactant-associated protein C [Platysternon megacephalum]
MYFSHITHFQKIHMNITYLSALMRLKLRFATSSALPQMFFLNIPTCICWKVVFNWIKKKPDALQGFKGQVESFYLSFYWCQNKNEDWNRKEATLHNLQKETNFWF